MEVHPWQQHAWSDCCRRIQDNRLPHACLLHAAAGFGLQDFAELLAHNCLCQSRTKEVMPCGRCAACKLVRGGNHPDLVMVTGSGAKNNIKIEHIRQLHEFIYNSSHLGSYRVVLIKEADNMTMQAANSLLKSLEEPPPNCVFLLTTHWPSRLLPTIRSRCQTVRLATPPAEQTQAWLAAAAGIDEQQAQEWLALYNQRPVDALQAWRQRDGDDDASSKKSFFADLKACLQNADLFLPTVEKWHQQQGELVHQWLLEMLSRKIREHIEGKGEASRLNYLYRLYDRQALRYRQLSHNLNARLQLESALSEWISLQRFYK